MMNKQQTAHFQALSPQQSCPKDKNCEDGSPSAEISIEYRENHENFKKYVIYNMWSENTQSVDVCICGNSLTCETIACQFCYRCGKLFHKYCYWPRIAESLYECPFCFIKNCLPNSQVTSTLFMGYFPQKTANSQYQCEFQVPLKFYRQQKQKISLRCVKICQSSIFRYTLAWPDNCSVNINSVESTRIRPMSLSSPLQRRYDDPIDISRSTLNSNLNKILITDFQVNDKNFKVSGKSQYIFAVVMTRQKQGHQIITKLLKSSLSKEQSFEALNYNFNRNFNDLSVSRVSISGNCQFSGQKITIPGRSAICNTHFQPFDAINLIISSINAKLSSRKWKCPICGKRAYDLIIDGYLKDIMSSGMIKQLIFEKGSSEPQFFLQENLSENSESSEQIEKSPQSVSLKKLQQCVQQIEQEQQKQIDSQQQMEATPHISQLNDQNGPLHEFPQNSHLPQQQKQSCLDLISEQSSSVMEVQPPPRSFHSYEFSGY